MKRGDKEERSRFRYDDEKVWDRTSGREIPRGSNCVEKGLKLAFGFAAYDGRRIRIISIYESGTGYAWDFGAST